MPNTAKKTQLNINELTEGQIIRGKLPRWYGRSKFYKDVCMANIKKLDKEHLESLERQTKIHNDTMINKLEKDKTWRKEVKDSAKTLFSFVTRILNRLRGEQKKLNLED